MPEPLQKPGKSKQNYQTPPEFLNAVRSLLKIDEFDMDLAASAQNTVAPFFYSEESNALEQPWPNVGWDWCNPPFTDIEAWVKKAYLECSGPQGAQVAMLLPASVGSNWFKRWVEKKCTVLFLNGRITFVGEKSPYPKDCMLLLYGLKPNFLYTNYTTWTWQEKLL